MRSPCHHGPTTGCLGRREALYAAAAGGAVVLSACGGSGDKSSDTPSSATSAGLELTTTAEVPAGGGVIIESAAIVITQPVAGEFKAFDATCTHEQCTVTSVENGSIICSCHGSEFDAATGEVTKGPATEPLASKSIAVTGESILLA